MNSQQKAVFVHHTLLAEFGPVGTFLTHRNAFELLIAVILSAQCTDERVNKVTPHLFERFGTPQALADASIEDVKDAIKSVNFFNNKAKNIKETAAILLKDYQGEVPDRLEWLIQLPGVGRKTANVVLGQAFGQPGITVDTHVKRLVNRIGWTGQSDPVKIEFELMKIWPKSIWTDMSSLLILHGRKTCQARKPNCSTCAIVSVCRLGSGGKRA